MSTATPWRLADGDRVDEGKTFGEVDNFVGIRGGSGTHTCPSDQTCQYRTDECNPACGTAGDSGPCPALRGWRNIHVGRSPPPWVRRRCQLATARVVAPVQRLQANKGL